MALDIPRLDGRFEVVSDFQPAGDQPAAIDELERRVRARRPARGAARRHRHGQERDHRVAGRAAAAADPGARAQQDALRPAGQGVPRADAQQRGRILRQLLRLLPARGLHPADRHLHREGLVGQRGGRAAAALGDDVAAHPARRRSWSPPCRRSTAWARPQEYLDRSVKLKVGEEVERDKLLRRLVDIQYTRNDMAFNRGTFRVRGDTLEIIPAYEELAHPHRVVRRRGREAVLPAPAHRRRDPRGRRAADLPGDATTPPAPSGWSGRSAASRRSWRSGWPSWSGRASCSRRSGCGCAPPTTSR